jgi:hypothetical protein
MPFQSEKQRRYLWVHHPKIAQRWSDKYGSKPVKVVAKKKVKVVAKNKKKVRVVAAGGGNPLGFLASLFRKPKFVNPLIESYSSQPTTTDDIKNAIIKGLEEYGAASELIGFADKFAQATERYPIFKKYPFLLPQIAIAETSGGKYVTRENNPLNWGARSQVAGFYSPQSWEQSIEDAITAIGGEENRGPKGSNRQRQTEYYKKFRETGNLKDFTDVYEPANGDYYNIISKGMPLFEKYLK